MHGKLRFGLMALMEECSLGLTVVARSLPSQSVDDLVACRRDDPARRARRYALFAPTLCGDRERLLHTVFGQVDVTTHPNEDRDGAPVLLAKDARKIEGAFIVRPARHQLPGFS